MDKQRLDFINYVAEYIADELTRDDMSYKQMVENALEAFEGGASNSGNTYTLKILKH